MSTVIESLLIKFGLDATGVEDGAKRGESALEGLKSTAIQAFAVIGSVAAIKMAFSHYLDAADAVNDLSEALDIDASALQAWSGAALLTGGTADGFNNSVKNLNSTIQLVATTGKAKALPFFEELGVKVTDAGGKARDTMDVMIDLSDKMGGLSAQQATGIGAKLGLDQGTINLLRKGRQGVEEMLKAQKELGEYTKKDMDAAGDFNDAMDMTGKAFGMTAAKIFTLFTPAITGVINTFKDAAVTVRKWVEEITPMVEAALEQMSDFWNEHKEVIIGALVAISAIIIGIYAPAWYAAAAATVIATYPLILMALAIAAIGVAIGLLYEDFMIWKEGGVSAFGAVWEAASQFWEAIKPLVMALGEFLGAVFDLFMAAGRLAFGAISRAFTSLWTDIKAPANEFFQWIAGKFEWFSNMVGKVAGWFGEAKEFVNEASDDIDQENDRQQAEADELNAGRREKEAKEAAAKNQPVSLLAPAEPQGEKPKPFAAYQPKQAVPASAALSPLALNNANKETKKEVTATQTIGTVNIRTASTDPKEVGKAFSKDTGGEFQNLVMAADSGVQQ